MSENALIQTLIAEHLAPSTLPTLYHGTVRARARRLVEGGLLPRKDLSVATVINVAGSQHAWLASSPECSCLSDVVAPFHALLASRFLGAEPAVIGVRIDDADALRPDEDFLTAALSNARGGQGLAKEVQREAIRRLNDFAELWPASLAGLAAVAHQGAIAAESVLTSRTISLSKNEREALLSCLFSSMPGAFRDPERFGSSEAIQRVHGSLLRWCQGETVSADDVLSLSGAVDTRTRYLVESALDKRWTEMKVRQSAPMLVAA